MGKLVVWVSPKSRRLFIRLTPPPNMALMSCPGPRKVVENALKGVPGFDVGQKIVWHSAFQSTQKGLGQKIFQDFFKSH